jgi:GntR family transcriptional regulator/MocR family aminotransferase
MLAITLDPSSSLPRYLQIYSSIRRSILEGRLAPGSYLPSSRALAEDLGIARNTVVVAYEQLRAEGYLEVAIGSGTRVSGVLPDALLSAGISHAAAASRVADVPQESASAHTMSPLSQRGLVLAAQGVLARGWGGTSGRAFRCGVPPLDIFPMDVWGRLAAHRWQRSSSALLGVGDPCGSPRLRQAIAIYLGAARGVRCSPEQVIVVSGTQQGMDLAARLLVDPGDAVWLEDPGYPGARDAFAGAGARIVRVPVDEHGLDVAEGERLAPDARLAYVTPSCQFPLTRVLAPERRTALLAWAARRRAWIFEDDYSGEFRYASAPLPAMQIHDRAGTVLYSGTFSKVLFPSIRLGYLVVPPALVGAFEAAKRCTDLQSPHGTQEVVADFIESGHFERHLRRLRRLYQERRRVLFDAARERLRGLLELEPADAGWHMVGWLPEGASDVRAAERAAAHGVDVVALSVFATRPIRPALLLGFGTLSPKAIRAGIDVLAAALSTRDARVGAKERGRAATA